MKLGPLVIGWIELDSIDIQAMDLDREYRWQGFVVALDALGERRGVFLAVRPIVGRGYA